MNILLQKENKGIKLQYFSPDYVQPESTRQITTDTSINFKHPLKIVTSSNNWIVTNHGNMVIFTLFSPIQKSTNLKLILKFEN